jgi:inositol polyphosphate 5-phosphatase INPP5B/F
VEKGFDTYVNIAAEFERSCFGMSLEDLVHAVGPVRNLPVTSSCVDIASSELTPKMGVPKELWVLIDTLWSGGAMQEKELFFSSSDSSEVALVRECLDTGVDIPASCSLHAVADTLVGFLAALAQPVISFDFFPQVLRPMLYHDSKNYYLNTL